MTMCDAAYYSGPMTTISFRADEATEEALRQLTVDEHDRSTVIREVIVEAARRRRDAALEAEARSLAANEADLREIRAVHEDLADLRAW
jgi:hypothetical protein